MFQGLAFGSIDIEGIASVAVGMAQGELVLIDLVHRQIAVFIGKDQISIFGKDNAAAAVVHGGKVEVQQIQFVVKIVKCQMTVVAVDLDIHVFKQGDILAVDHDLIVQDAWIVLAVIGLSLFAGKLQRQPVFDLVGLSGM